MNPIIIVGMIATAVGPALIKVGEQIEKKKNENASGNNKTCK